MPSPIAAADLDGDTHMDLIVGNTLSSDVSVFLGQGNGSGAPQSRYATGINPRGIAPIDLDRNGTLDLFIANRGSSDISRLRNQGNGHFGDEHRQDLPGNGEDAAAASDVNGDGLEDLIIGFYSSDQVSVYLAGTPGGFSLSSTAASGGHVWQMAVGDLNGDGLLDAVTANSSTSTAGVLMAVAPGVLSNAVTYPVGSFPLSVVLGDPDGDGDLDMLTSNYSGGTFTLYRNNGAGVFGDRYDLPAAIAGSCAVFYDRDGDGDLDLAALDELADHVRLYATSNLLEPHISILPSPSRGGLAHTARCSQVGVLPTGYPADLDRVPPSPPRPAKHCPPPPLRATRLTVAARDRSPDRRLQIKADDK